MNARALGLTAIIALAGCTAQKTQEPHLEERINYYEEACYFKKEAMKPENENRKNNLLSFAFNLYETAKKQPDKAAISTLQQADILAKWGDLTEAMKYADEAIRLKPCIETYNGKGQIAIRQQLFEVAIESFTSAIKLTDNEASRWGRLDSYLLAGTSQGNKDYLKKAAKDAKKCQKFSPELPDTYIAEAAIRLSMQDPAEIPTAYDLFKTAIRLMDEGKDCKRYNPEEVRKIWTNLNTDDKTQ